MTTSTSWQHATPAVRTRVHSRASNYEGTSAEELYYMIPENLRDSPSEIDQWLDEHDVSHIQSENNGGSSTPDNLVFERSEANRARGSDDITEFELQRIKVQNRMDAERIENTHTDDITTDTAPINDGAVIAAGAAVAGVDSALGGAEILGGVASLGSVVLPLAGSAWAANKAAQTAKTTEGKLVRGGIAATAAWLALTSPIGIAAVGAYGVFKLTKSITRNTGEIINS